MGSETQRPVADFILNPLWHKAHWSATTFRWHPTGEAPPVMGLCFENATPAQSIFSQWLERYDNTDSLDELRISIIEGNIPGQRPGYSVHMSADLEGLLARATMDGVVNPAYVLLPSRWNRMHPVTGSPPLLSNFEREYRKHGEFLLAPVTRRWDGQFWFDLEFGIVKRKLHLRNAAEISEGDVDFGVFQQPATDVQ